MTDTPAEIARSLSEAQRRLVLDSGPGGWGDQNQSCGVEIRGAQYRTAKALEKLRLGTYTHGSPFSDLYFNHSLGLAVRAVLAEVGSSLQKTQIAPRKEAGK